MGSVPAEDSRHVEMARTMSLRGVPQSIPIPSFPFAFLAFCVANLPLSIPTRHPSPVTRHFSHPHLGASYPASYPASC
jgi:hypothetical protein